MTTDYQALTAQLNGVLSQQRNTALDAAAEALARLHVALTRINDLEAQIAAQHSASDPAKCTTSNT